MFLFFEYPFQIGVFAHSGDREEKKNWTNDNRIYEQQFDRKLYKIRDTKTDLKKLWPLN